MSTGETIAKFAQSQHEAWRTGAWRECGTTAEGIAGSRRVAIYWTEGLNLHGLDGCVRDQPWSAAFVCWCMRAANMPLNLFPYSSSHQAYIRWAINNTKQSKPSKSYYGRRVEDYAPKPGDLIAQWRKAKPTDPDPDISFDHQPNDFYPSHCDIVISVSANVVVAVGGNVSDRVSKTEFRALHGIIQPKKELICVMECKH